LYKSLILLFAILFASCNEKSGGVIPLQDNTSFNYINASPRDETVTKIVKVSGVKKENGFTYAKLSGNPFFGKDDAALNIKVNEKTGEVFTIENGKDEMLLPEGKDLRKGYSWEYNGYNAVVSAMGEKVAAEKQTFEDCIRVDYRLSITFNSEVWLKPGVGIVKFAAYRTNPPSMSQTYYVWDN
jgi:hypothetical protein